MLLLVKNLTLFALITMYVLTTICHVCNLLFGARFTDLCLLKLSAQLVVLCFVLIMDISYLALLQLVLICTISISITVACSFSCFVFLHFCIALPLL